MFQSILNKGAFAAIGLFFSLQAHAASTPAPSEVTLRFIPANGERIELGDFRIEARLSYESPRKNLLEGNLFNRFNPCKDDIVVQTAASRNVDTGEVEVTYPDTLGTRAFCGYHAVSVDLTVSNPSVNQLPDFMSHYWPGEFVQKFGWSMNAPLSTRTETLKLDCAYRQRFRADPRLAFRCRFDGGAGLRDNPDTVEILTSLQGPPIR